MPGLEKYESLEDSVDCKLLNIRVHVSPLLLKAGHLSDSSICTRFSKLEKKDESV